MFTQALSLLGEDQEALRGPLTGQRAERAAAAVHRAHEAIVEAVISGDGRRAAHRMLTHLTALQQELLQRTVTSDSPAAAPGGAGQAGRQLAQRIRQDIAKLGWPLGRNLGSETELLDHYGSGRAGLREAIRILERHGAGGHRPLRG